MYKKYYYYYFLIGTQTEPFQQATDSWTQSEDLQGLHIEVLSDDDNDSGDQNSEPLDDNKADEDYNPLKHIISDKAPNTPQLVSDM